MVEATPENNNIQALLFWSNKWTIETPTADQHAP